MNQLDKYKNIHKDSDIYILASGKSVDFIDNSFFHKKIIIGTNQVYKKQKCNYLVRKEPNLIENIINENKSTIHFISRGACGGFNDKNLNIVNKLNDEYKKKIVIYNHQANTRRPITKLPPDKELVVSYSTITTAIHLAAYMGAKNIILLGHDCGTVNGEPNFNGYHTDSTYKIAHSRGKKEYIEWLSKIENQTIDVKKLLKKKYGCNVYSLNPFINFGLEGNIYKK
jgi:hypothetical protein